MELFWSAFSSIPTEYGEILRICPYAVRMQENADQNNSGYGHLFTQWEAFIFLGIPVMPKNVWNGSKILVQRKPHNFLGGTIPPLYKLSPFFLPHIFKNVSFLLFQEEKNIEHSWNYCNTIIIYVKRPEFQTHFSYRWFQELFENYGIFDMLW